MCRLAASQVRKGLDRRLTTLLGCLMSSWIDATRLFVGAVLASGQGPGTLGCCAACFVVVESLRFVLHQALCALDVWALLPSPQRLKRSWATISGLVFLTAS